MEDMSSIIIAALLFVIMVLGGTTVYYRHSNVFLEKYLSMSTEFLIRYNLIGVWNGFCEKHFYENGGKIDEGNK